MDEKEIIIASKFFAISNFGMPDPTSLQEMDRLWYQCKQDVPEDDDGTPGIEIERRTWEGDIRKELEEGTGYCLEEWAKVRGNFIRG